MAGKHWQKSIGANWILHKKKEHPEVGFSLKKGAL